FIYRPLPVDLVSCVMTSSLNCVTVNPVTSAAMAMIAFNAPEVTFSPCFDTITTVGAKPFRLKGGIPLGGTYSGPGVNSMTGIFTPSLAGTGLKTIQYTYTNVTSCSDGKSKTILVLANPAFSCGNPLTDLRDHKVYPTVQIGSQCWMQTNLDFGMTISDLTPQTDNCLVEKYIRYSSFAYSSFYQWDELMRYNSAEASQGICPPGWHIPSSAEWDELIASCNDPGKAGGTLKDKFLPDGFQSYQHGLLYLNNTWAFTTGFAAGSMYWTSTMSGGRAVARGINEMNLSVSLCEASRGNALSARCLKD
ncbi:MAG: FISUMP domain-containing protein, partial [Bacteroidales bacterium]|nr:FISUMP domain-containing protein [Bacteroidales bacterium]